VARENTLLRRCRIQPVPDRHSRQTYPWPTTADRGYRCGGHTVPAPHAHLVFLAKRRGDVPTADHIIYLRDVSTKTCRTRPAADARRIGVGGHCRYVGS
jgi:hypothetical protein